MRPEPASASAVTPAASRTARRPVSAAIRENWEPGMARNDAPESVATRASLRPAGEYVGPGWRAEPAASEAVPARSSPLDFAVSGVGAAEAGAAGTRKARAAADCG